MGEILIHRFGRRPVAPFWVSPWSRRVVIRRCQPRAAGVVRRFLCLCSRRVLVVVFSPVTSLREAVLPLLLQRKRLRVWGARFPSAWHLIGLRCEWPGTTCWWAWRAAEWLVAASVQGRPGAVSPRPGAEWRFLVRKGHKPPFSVTLIWTLMFQG